MLNIVLFLICALFAFSFILALLEKICKSEKGKNVLIACVAIYIIGGLIYASVNFIFGTSKPVSDWQYEKENKQYIDKAN